MEVVEPEAVARLSHKVLVMEMEGLFWVGGNLHSHLFVCPRMPAQVAMRLALIKNSALLRQFSIFGNWYGTDMVTAARIWF